VPKSNPGGEICARGIGGVPVPVNDTLTGLATAAGSLKVISADLIPVAVGLKVTAIVHLLPPGKLLGQLLVWAKSALFAPPTVTLVMLEAALPAFNTVTLSGGLLMPTGCGGNVKP
jgi:hypothetical protein